MELLRCQIEPVYEWIIVKLVPDHRKWYWVEKIIDDFEPFKTEEKAQMCLKECYENGHYDYRIKCVRIN